MLVRFAGSSRAVADQATRAIEMIADNNEAGRCALLSDDKIIWRSLAASTLRDAPDLVWRVVLQPANVASFLEILDRTRPGHSCESRWQAGLGDGRIRVIDRLPKNGDESREVRNETMKHIEMLRGQAQDFGGALIIEQAPAELKASHECLGNLRLFGPLVQRIKEQLDPGGILSPGRF